MTTSNIQEWRNTVTIEARETIPGSWAERVEQSKAIRAFAAANNKKIQDVGLDMVQKTDMGIKGYAALYAQLPQAAPKTGGDGTNSKPPPPAPQGNKRRAGGNAAQEVSAALGQADDQNQDGLDNKNPDGQETNNPKKRKTKDQMGPKKEREVRELLAMEQSSDNCMALVATAMQKDPAWWSWATAAVQSYRDCRQEVLKGYCDEPFFQSLKVAALSPKETQKLKKQYAEDYVTKLVQFTTSLGPKIQEMSEAAYQIESMASAKNNAKETLDRQRSGLGKPKAKAKAKGKSRRTTSAANLPAAP